MQNDMHQMNPLPDTSMQIMQNNVIMMHWQLQVQVGKLELVTEPRTNRSPAPGKFQVEVELAATAGQVETNHDMQSRARAAATAYSALTSLEGIKYYFEVMMHSDSARSPHFADAAAVTV